MKATPADKPFDDPDWFFEVKLDGYRVEAVVDDGKVRLWTRNKQDAARYFPDLAAAKPAWINAKQAIVDGEVVALDEEGNPAFTLLQDRAGMGRFGPRGDGRDGQPEAESRPELRRAGRVLRLRPDLPRRPLAARRAARAAQAPAAHASCATTPTSATARTSRPTARRSTRSWSSAAWRA